MNDFSYESRAKEKIKDMIGEGMRSQEFHRSGGGGFGGGGRRR